MAASFYFHAHAAYCMFYHVTFLTQLRQVAHFKLTEKENSFLLRML